MADSTLRAAVLVFVRTLLTLCANVLHNVSIHAPTPVKPSNKERGSATTCCTPAVFFTRVNIVGGGSSRNGCGGSCGGSRGGGGGKDDADADLLEDIGAELGEGGGESGTLELRRGTLTEVLRRCECDGGVITCDSCLFLRRLFALDVSAEAVRRTTNITVKRFAGGTPRTRFQQKIIKRTNAFPGRAIFFIERSKLMSGLSILSRLCHVSCIIVIFSIKV